MNRILKPHLRKFILAFFDDILVYSQDMQQQVEHLKMVLLLLRQHHLCVNKKKCSFGQCELEYVRHVVFGSGPATDPRKVQVMVEWPILKDIKSLSLRGFLDLTSYYKHFVREYGKIAISLA